MSNLETFSDLLREWNGGRVHGSKRRFSVEMGVSEVTVGRWTKGYMIREDLLPKASKVLGLPPDRILNALKNSLLTVGKKSQISWDKGEAENVLQGPTNQQLVLLQYSGIVSASGISYEIDELPQRSIMLPETTSGESRLVFYVSGDSMEPDIKSGSSIIAFPPSILNSGDVAICEVDGQILLKRVVERSRFLELESINPDCKPIRVAKSKVKIIAVVDQIITSFRGR